MIVKMSKTGGVIHSFMREREREERHEREQASRDILLISVHVGRSFSFLIFFLRRLLTCTKFDKVHHVAQQCQHRF
jgi:hypothetical protein